MINLLLVDDHELLRHGVKSLISINADLNVVADVGSFEEALEVITCTPVDIIVLDISLPGISGLQAVNVLGDNFPNIRIIILSGYTEKEYIVEFMKSNISAYVVKTSVGEHLLSAIQEVNKGKTYCSEEIMDMTLMNYEDKQSEVQAKKTVSLTIREKEIFDGICEGLTNIEIASSLFINERTVQVHCSNIISKVGAKNTAELMGIASELKII